MWILTAPIIILLMSSTIFIINIVRILITKLHPKSISPAPMAVKKAVRATFILVIIINILFEPYPIWIFVDSSVWPPAHSPSIPTWEGVKLWVTLPTSISCPHQPSRPLRVISVLLCQPWSRYCSLRISQRLMSEILLDLLSQNSSSTACNRMLNHLLPAWPWSSSKSHDSKINESLCKNQGSIGTSCLDFLQQPLICSRLNVINSNSV